ncbi:SDR family oxidoreductase [Pseudoroseomonas wenyumeiae]|uniref:SDR family oxidoreductase n=1 Tax=Teichococcus wenyumeiae TaxID=2478470 RepID=A0A3A9JXL7_9PROT|nr:SDR family oxidoreductase [Pseudoroseomonas wenyumeiae]RKK03809.1 SDR family oxidoreductase [Pseudoroseomonas wenyumeiae]RMI24720.1 SDR family oxidoreductase [Pseudoroseomonas wenyumeiae]
MSDSSPVALVTGGAHGIGAGIATHLAGKGWRVVTADLKPAPGAPGRHVVADIAEEAAVAALLDGIAAREGRLDAMVCNAGIMVRKPVEELSLAEWQRVLGTNLTSTFLLARAGAKLLRASGRGAIVTIASTRAHMSEPDTESYSASKGGLLALTHALAVSLGPDIRVNCVSPGWIDVAGEDLRPEDHAQHPAGRVGRVEDIAALVAWLVGPEAGFVTGSEFISDGGMTRKMIYAE